MESIKKSIWIGLVEVRSLPGSAILSDVSCAYTNVLTWASSPSGFSDKAQELMDYLGLQLVKVENAEPLSERRKVAILGAEIDQIASEVEKNPEAIRYMTFHTWNEVPS